MRFALLRRPAAAITSGESIRAFRQRLGLTQWALAEQVGVDQGRVGRWERGVEKPRPANAARLRGLMLYADDSETCKRQEKRIMHGLRPALIMDRTARLICANEASHDYYRQRFIFRLEEHRGIDFERLTPTTSFDGAWSLFRASGILGGKLLFLRFYLNSFGSGYVTQYEPVFEAGQPARVSAEIVDSFDSPRKSGYVVERAEAVCLDAPDDLVEIFRAPCVDSGEPR